MTFRRGPDWSGRLARFRQAWLPLELDAVVVSSRINIRYLTGFAGTAGLFLVDRDRAWLLVDGRYEQSVRAALAERTMGSVDLESVPGPYSSALAALLARLGRTRVGFEAADVTVAALSLWQDAAAAVAWTRTDKLVEDLRLHKDDYERQVFRRAGQLLSDVASRLEKLLAPGRTELEVARSIDRELEARGFSGPAFPTVVASGPGTARPHARPGTRRLAAGDLVLLDFGGVLDGYCVDLTRMAVIGAARPEVAELFEAVRDAQAAALEAVRPGVVGSAVDAAARRVLTDRGLGGALRHATGHGLGLEVHEAPRLGLTGTREHTDTLAEGMVCTIEPGAYVDGLGGVRIEDDVLVTSDGYEALTSAPRDLLVV